MIEIEIKVKVNDPARIRRNIGALGCKSMEKQFQRDTYFKSSFRDFSETGEILRVRRQNPGPDLITFKGSKLKSEMKVREEIEVNISNVSDAIELLRRLGCEPWITIEKEREIYKFGKFIVSLDKVKDLGLFMEIETKIAGIRSKHEVEQEIFNLLTRIGSSKNLIERRTYLELFLTKHESAVI